MCLSKCTQCLKAHSSHWKALIMTQGAWCGRGMKTIVMMRMRFNSLGKNNNNHKQCHLANNNSSKRETHLLHSHRSSSSSMKHHFSKKKNKCQLLWKKPKRKIHLTFLMIASYCYYLGFKNFF